MDDSGRVENVLDDEDTRCEIVADYIDIILASDNKDIVDFYDKVYDMYEHEIIQFTSELLLEGKY